MRTVGVKSINEAAVVPYFEYVKINEPAVVNLSFRQIKFDRGPIDSPYLSIRRERIIYSDPVFVSGLWRQIPFKTMLDEYPFNESGRFSVIAVSGGNFHSDGLALGGYKRLLAAATKNISTFEGIFGDLNEIGSGLCRDLRSIGRFFSDPNLLFARPVQTGSGNAKTR